MVRLLASCPSLRYRRASLVAAELIAQSGLTDHLVGDRIHQNEKLGRDLYVVTKVHFPWMNCFAPDHSDSIKRALHANIETFFH